MVGTEIFHLHRSVRKPRRLACDNMELINLSHKNKKLFDIGEIEGAFCVHRPVVLLILISPLFYFPSFVCEAFTDAWGGWLNHIRLGKFVITRQRN